MFVVDVGENAVRTSEYDEQSATDDISPDHGALEPENVHREADDEREIGEASDGAGLDCAERERLRLEARPREDADDEAP